VLSHLEWGQYKMQRLSSTSRWRRLQAVLSLRRLIHITLSVAVIVSIAIQLPINNKARAWSGNLPTCTVSGGAFSWSWKDRVQQLLGINVDGYAGSIIIGKRNTDSDVNVPIQVWFSTNVTVDQTGGSTPDRRFVFSGGDGAVDIINNPSSPLWQQINSSTAPFSQTVTLSDFTCVNTYTKSDGNPVYSNSYTGNYFGTSVPNQQGTTCDTFDIACKIKDVFQGVQNTFASVGQFIVKGIANIFIPTQSQITEFFVDLNTFHNTKFGFLTYPINWTIDLFEELKDPSNDWCTQTSCSRSFGNLFGTPLAVDLYTMKNSFPTYWNAIIVIIRGTIVFTLILTIKNALMRLLRG